MKLYKSILAAAVLAVSAGVMTGCDEDLAVPPLSIPSTDVRANTTIEELKQQYWSTENNYCTQVGKTAEGDDVIIGGRIIASDEGGNIYQNLMLQDETGAITIAVLTNSTDGLSDLNTKYKVGEEMYINLTGLYVGKYAGLFQVGTAGDYNGTPQTSKMSAADFLAHTYLNGLPDPSKCIVREMTIDEINSASSVADQQDLQSQLVEIKNVSFVGGGDLTWGETGSSSTAVNRYLIDEAGNRLLVRNSNKSDFCDQVLPAGHGDVKGILGYYNGTWQFLFRTPSDCTDFGGESYAPVIEGEGSADAPYTVGAVLAGAAGSEVWVTGYIVGWVDGQVLSTGAKFTTPATVASNILIAASADETNIANCVPVQLTSGSAVRTALNLQDNASNLGKQVAIKGNLEAYFGSAGIKSTTAYAWGDKGDESGSTTDPGTSENNVEFRKVTTVTSGKQYLLVAEGKAAELISKNYGYLSVSDVTDTDGTITAKADMAYTITATTGGYTIQMSDDRYLYQTGTYNSFNFDSSAVEGSVFTIDMQADGSAKITNVSTGKYIQYSASYNSYGCYDTVTGTMPTLYERVN